jgi:hypothetical protein
VAQISTLQSEIQQYAAMEAERTGLAEADEVMANLMHFGEDDVHELKAFKQFFDEHADVPATTTVAGSSGAGKGSGSDARAGVQPHPAAKELSFDAACIALQKAVLFGGADDGADGAGGAASRPQELHLAISQFVLTRADLDGSGSISWSVFNLTLTLTPTLTLTLTRYLTQILILTLPLP